MTRPVLSKSAQQQVARERIRILFLEAEKSPVYANRYVQLARKIAMRTRIKIPRELKRKFCQHCYHYLRPGVNSRVRTRDGKVIIFCFKCKKFMRILLK